MISAPLAKMTVAQLEARIRIHEYTAENFEKKREPRLAKEFRGMADTYRAELMKRMNGATNPEPLPAHSPDGDAQPTKE